VDEQFGLRVTEIVEGDPAAGAVIEESAADGAEASAEQ
jgi:hypothetical protein